MACAIAFQRLSTVLAAAFRKCALSLAKARTYDALWRAVGNICGLFEPDECWNYLKDTGYVAD